MYILLLTFELGGFQKFLPLGADFIHASGHLSRGIVFPIDQLLTRLLQSVDTALIGRKLCLKGLVLLHFSLQVGGVLCVCVFEYVCV